MSREFAIEGDPRSPSLKLFGSTDADRYFLYRPNRLEIRSRRDALITGVDHPDATLAGRANGLPLDEIERLFLIGNVLWNAIAGPFAGLLPGARTVAAGVGQLDIHLPHRADPLCPHRRLLIADDGIAYRCDYQMQHIHPGVLADTLSAHASFNGILIATLRRARAIEADGRLGTNSLLDVEIFDVRFQ
ncbi:hypothetical protein VPG91_02220 [Nitrospirillum amazonense]|uniref:hypothetical protein n=1 Tax=Nitrospirillum amazonense TaxID=28077 RepID=UPI002DD43B56|nr:hypothetical protein [Nitrospirillum amazonense]MEC4589790.1 hypothetical protein [Nitrospirillum amazonense]